MGPFWFDVKEWTVNFDPSRELVARNKVWEILPSLPLVFWTKEALETIDNNIGVFIRLEPNWFSKPDRRWAWIQVEVDTSEGLVGNVDIVMGSKTWHQKVDYWKIPFRCHRFHKIGHLKANCNRFSPLYQAHSKVWGRKSTLNRKENVESLSVENGKGAEVVVQAEATMEPQSQAPIEFEKSASGNSKKLLI
jgi:hypothetical protein